MIDLNDIWSLTDFQRDARAQIRRLKRSGRPVVLTVNGKAEVVVQSAQAYQRLLDAVERAEAIEGIQRGLEDMKAGRTRPIEEFFQEMRGKHGIPD